MSEITPSEFFRQLGFTGGTWLCLGNIPVHFPLEEMNESCLHDLDGSSEEPVGFYHPRITPRPNCLSWWSSLFCLNDGTIIQPTVFVKTPAGYKMTAFILPGHTSRREYFLADLIVNGIRPIVDAKYHVNLVVNGDREILEP